MSQPSRRWASIGLGAARIRLEVVQCGGVTCTTITRLRRFFRRLAAAKANGHTRHEPLAKYVRQRIDRELDQEGF